MLKHRRTKRLCLFFGKIVGGVLGLSVVSLDMKEAAIRHPAHKVGAKKTFLVRCWQNHDDARIEWWR